jgi:hypothetical protein
MIVSRVMAHARMLPHRRACGKHAQRLLPGLAAKRFFVRRLWRVSDEEADRKPAYAVLVNEARIARVYDVPPDDLDRFIPCRIALCGRVMRHLRMGGSRRQNHPLPMRGVAERRPHVGTRT